MRDQPNRFVPRVARQASLAAAILFMPALALAQASIDLPVAGAAGYSPFGKPETQTYGQTFRTPDATNVGLTDFSFWMTSNPDGMFKAYVYAWDQALGHAVGPALFTSAVMGEPTAGGGYQQVLVNTGGVTLDPLAQYVAFFSTSGLGGSGTTAWAQTSADYADGSFVYFNNADDLGALTTQSWDCTGCRDVAFQANFSPVVATPEPASVVLLATGLIGIIGVARKRVPG